MPRLEQAGWQYSIRLARHGAGRRQPLAGPDLTTGDRGPQPGGDPSACTLADAANHVADGPRINVCVYIRPAKSTSVSVMPIAAGDGRRGQCHRRRRDRLVGDALSEYDRNDIVFRPRRAGAVVDCHP